MYEGHCKSTLTGAVYADELRKAQSDNRITKVPYDPSKGVLVFADLGWGDNTSLWFVQSVAMQFRILRGYQNRHKLWAHYLEQIQKSGYIIKRIMLPHDGAAGQLGTGKSIQELTIEAGYRCGIVPKLSVVDGINALRTIFPNCYFDEAGCKDGLQALRRYVWAETLAGNPTREPKHDENSHYADAARYFAVGFHEPIDADERAAPLLRKLRERTVEVTVPGQGSTSWMG